METSSNRKEIVILAGGTGLIGKGLAKLLQERNYEIRILTRSHTDESKGFYHWNPSKDEIDTRVFGGVTHIINLCGAGIADKRWSEVRKKELLDSRVGPAAFLAKFKHEMPLLKHYISASGINCYDFKNYSKVYSENDSYGTDYLSQLVKKWEESAHEFSDVCLVSCIRISMVLTEQGGALEKMKLPIKLGIGSPIGSGKQWMPWIHVDDLNAIFLHVLSKGLEGNFNASSEIIDNRAFMKSFAQCLNKPFFFPPVPAFVMKLIFGEMSSILLNGVQTSNKKLQDTGYKLKFPCLKEALLDIYG